MNLAISNIAWQKDEDKLAYDLMKTYGYTGLEIAPTRLFPNDPYSQPIDDIHTAKKNILNNDINIVAMQSLHYGKDGISLFENRSKRNALLDYTKKAIDFAQTIGAKVLVFGSPKLRVMTDESKDYTKAVNFFSELGEYAYQNNCHICIEANPQEYNTNFINTTERAYNLVKEVNVDGFGLHIDTGTIIINKEDTNILNKSADVIKHVHISSPFLHGVNPAHDSVFKSVCKCLKSNGYDKYVSIEMRRAEDNAIEHIEKCLEYTVSIFGG